jgi:hypothetical protein
MATRLPGGPGAKLNSDNEYEPDGQWRSQSYAQQEIQYNN